MNEEQFVNQRRDNWQKLSEYCIKGDVSIRALSSRDFHDFIRLYRKCCTDLSDARTQGANSVLVDYLNGLVGRAYSILYRAPAPGIFISIKSGIVFAAQAVRRQQYFIYFSIILFFLMSFIVSILMSAYPQTKGVFIPEGMQGNTQAWVQGLPNRSISESAMATGMYASNNPLVALISIALGAGTFGIGTFYELWQNASNIGALAQQMAVHGKLGFLLASLAPHGISEIGGFMIASGAGFALGYALINPGRYRRGVALAKVGKDAIAMACTSVVMTWIAAPIEGWFSFNSNIPSFAKVLFALIALTAWLSFFIGYGVEPPTSPKPNNARHQPDLLNNIAKIVEPKL